MQGRAISPSAHVLFVLLALVGAAGTAAAATPLPADTPGTTVPGLVGLEFVAGRQDGKRTLTLRDAQHEYVLVEKPAQP